MVAKHPPRTAQDNTLIQALPASLPSTPVDVRLVYDTLRKPTRRGIAPGPNGDRFEFLQSVTYDPYGNAEASMLLHAASLTWRRMVNSLTNGMITTHRQYWWPTVTR